jgi:hypothetical protein
VIRCTRGSVTLWTTPKGASTAWKNHVELTKFDVKPGDGIQIVHVALPDPLGY